MVKDVPAISVTVDYEQLAANACVICTQNSTPMPMDMTRFTTEMAFSWMPHRYIRPCTRS